MYTNGMGTIIILVSIIVLALVFVGFMMVRFGQYTERNEQRAYVMEVLHNVEARGEVDCQNRNW